MGHVQGVPFSLWNQNTFETIGAKIGGLAQVSPFTANGWDVSVMKLKVKGLSSGVSKIIINYKPLPFSAFVSLAADQSENIISPFGRMLIKKQELSGGSVSPPATSYSGKAQSNPLEKQSQSTSKSTNCVVNGPAVDLSLNEFNNCNGQIGASKESK